jgi:type IV pilus assembly protein PilB
MYAALRHLLKQEYAAPPNIITIEDPVEIDLPGITQIEVDDQRLTPAKALRSILRHDPDVILIGEIRDRETAEIALRAAMTGHLVISTLHTRTATSAISRLLDLGVEPYLVASSVHLVIAQRLVRRLCPQCRTPFPLTSIAAIGLGDRALDGQTAWTSTGCKYCAGSGFKGRLAIFELFEIDNEAASLIAVNSMESSYQELQKRRGETTLRSDSIAKVLAGIATPAECIRTISGAG